MQCLFCTPYSCMYGNTKVIPQVSQAHVTSGLCKRVGVALKATVETLYEKKKYWGLRYFISHTKSQRLLVTRHRLSCEKVNSHNTLVTGAWDTCVYTRALRCLLRGHARWVWPRTVRESGLCHWTRITKNSWSTRSDLIPIALTYNGFQPKISAVLLFWTIYINK